MATTNPHSRPTTLAQDLEALAGRHIESAGRNQGRADRAEPTRNYFAQGLYTGIALARMLTVESIRDLIALHQED